MLLGGEFHGPETTHASATAARGASHSPTSQSGHAGLTEDVDQLSVEVDDDGCGVVVASTRRGNGLTNMEDRLEALAGALDIVASPGNGTTLRAVIAVRHTLPITI